MGNVGNTIVAPMNETAWYNQHNNVNKTSENWPMAGGTQIFNANVNVNIARKDADRVNNRLQCEDFVRPNAQSIASGIPSHQIRYHTIIRTIWYINIYFSLF